MSDSAQNSFLAAAAGDRRRTGEGLHPRHGKPAAVIADLGNNPGTVQIPRPGNW